MARVQGRGCARRAAEWTPPGGAAVVGGGGLGAHMSGAAAAPSEELRRALARNPATVTRTVSRDERSSPEVAIPFGSDLGCTLAGDEYLRRSHNPPRARCPRARRWGARTRGEQRYAD